MTEQENRQYFNDPQMYSLLMNTRDEVIFAGRGVGKGAIQAGRMQFCFQGMPGSMGGFVSPSVKRCLTNILPSMLIHLEVGIQEGSPLCRWKETVESPPLENANLYACQLGEYHIVLQWICVQYHIPGQVRNV